MFILVAFLPSIKKINMLEQFTTLFQYSNTSLFVVSTYNPWMILLSLFIAIFSSFMGFQVASQTTNQCPQTESAEQCPIRKRILLLISSFTLGGGVWSMHFIGMLALKLCTDVSFQLLPTLLSVIPALAASWVALHLITQNKMKPSTLIIGGIVVGSGIGAMH